MSDERQVMPNEPTKQQVDGENMTAGGAPSRPETRANQFRKKPVVIEAHRWWKNGDHPEDGDERFPLKAAPLNPFLTVPSDANGSASDPRYTGEHAGELYEGKVVRYFRHPSMDGERSCEYCAVRMHEHGWIDTKEGGHIVCPGDWIITGVQGERYPCKPDIFAATYEPADSQEAEARAAWVQEAERVLQWQEEQRAAFQPSFVDSERLLREALRLLKGRP